MKLFDTVILSGDTTTGFLDFAPLVAKAWKKLFDVEVILGVLTEIPMTYNPHNKGADYFYINPILHNIPIQAQAKLYRSYIACLPMFNSKVNLINDLDMLPLSTPYFEEKLSQRKYGELACLTCDEFYNTKEMQGKFPIGNTTAEGYVFKELFNSADLSSFESFVNSFIGMRIFDDYEDPSKEDFSHESLVRALMYGKPNNLNIKKIEGEAYPFTNRTIDRTDWKYDKDKLYAGYYFESHMVRPYKDNIDKIKPLEEYIDSLSNQSSC
jgi:hypothetical protein